MKPSTEVDMGGRGEDVLGGVTQNYFGYRSKVIWVGTRVQRMVRKRSDLISVKSWINNYSLRLCTSFRKHRYLGYFKYEATRTALFRGNEATKRRFSTCADVAAVRRNLGTPGTSPNALSTYGTVSLENRGIDALSSARCSMCWQESVCGSVAEAGRNNTPIANALLLWGFILGCYKVQNMMIAMRAVLMTD